MITLEELERGIDAAKEEFDAACGVRVCLHDRGNGDCGLTFIGKSVSTGIDTKMRLNVGWVS